MYKIVANWKMYLSIRQSREMAATLVQWWKGAPCRDVELILCPSTLALADVRAQLGNVPVRLGVQDLSLSKNLGAFTGQLAAQQAVEAGATYAILGHSEMRRFYHVTNAMIRQQVEVALSHKLHPIVCVGESEAERESGRTDHVIGQQIHQIFAGMPSPQAPISIAYEPLWAIGTGKPVSPQEANRVHQLILHTMREFTSQPVSVLYGGSVDAVNAKTFLKQPQVHGLLVGSASTKPNSFHDLVAWLQTQCELTV